MRIRLRGRKQDRVVETSALVEDETPMAPLLRQIGTHLRQAREERELDVRDVAEFLRIRAAYLHDLEDGELAKIPGRAYALGFLRSYADYLGFDGEAIVDEVKRVGAALPENPRLHYREPLPESHRPPLILAGAALLVGAVIYVGWQTWQDRGGPAPHAASPVETAPRSDVAAAEAPAEFEPLADPEATATSLDDPVLAALGEPLGALDLPELPPVPNQPRLPDVFVADDETEADAGRDTAAVDPDAVLSSILDVDPGAAPAPEVAAAAEAGDEAPPPSEEETLMQLILEQAGGVEPRPLGDEAREGRVVLVASAPSWVQVRSADRGYVWTRTMEPGDAYFVPDRADLALWTGNAGGLHVIVDGRVLEPLGATGQVRRDIPLEADRLHSQFGGN